MNMEWSVDVCALYVPMDGINGEPYFPSIYLPVYTCEFALGYALKIMENTSHINMGPLVATPLVTPTLRAIETRCSQG